MYSNDPDDLGHAFRLLDRDVPRDRLFSFFRASMKIRGARLNRRLDRRNLAGFAPSPGPIARCSRISHACRAGEPRAPSWRSEVEARFPAMISRHFSTTPLSSSLFRRRADNSSLSACQSKRRALRETIQQADYSSSARFALSRSAVTFSVNKATPWPRMRSAPSHP